MKKIRDVTNQKKQGGKCGAYERERKIRHIRRDREEMERWEGDNIGDGNKSKWKSRGGEKRWRKKGQSRNEERVTIENKEINKGKEGKRNRKEGEEDGEEKAWKQISWQEEGGRKLGKVKRKLGRKKGDGVDEKKKQVKSTAQRKEDV